MPGKLEKNDSKGGKAGGWILMMEDDVGASLAVPRGWAHTLTEVIIVPRRNNGNSVITNKFKCKEAINKKMEK